MRDKRSAAERVARESAPLTDEQVAKLKEAIPEAFSEGKVNTIVHRWFVHRWFVRRLSQSF